MGLVMLWSRGVTVGPSMVQCEEQGGAGTGTGKWHS